MVEIVLDLHARYILAEVSVLNREPMWLKSPQCGTCCRRELVSVLNREPMWLKCDGSTRTHWLHTCFSAQP